MVHLFTRMSLPCFANRASNGGQLVNLDREVMTTNARRATDAQLARKPLEYVCMQADAAAQTAFALPMQSTMTHGTDR